MRKNLILLTLFAATFCLTAVLSQAQAATSAGMSNDDLNSRIQKLSDRIDELEVQRALNRVTLSGTLINRYEMLDSTTGVAGTDETRNSIRAPITYFSLNADANVSKNIKAYASLSFSKFWQQENRWEPYSYWSASETGSFGLSGSTARFDRAYATYEFDNIPLTFAAGRMATNNGEPINQLDGFPRMGTYPRLAYNSIFDGAAAIFDFTKYLKKNNSLILRVFYTPFSNVSMTSRTTQLTDTDNNGNTQTIDSSTPLWAFLLEYARTKSPWMERFQFDFFLYNYSNFYNDGFAGSQQSSPILTGGTTPPGNASYTEAERAESLFFGFENIAYSGLNFDVNALFVHSNYPQLGLISMSQAVLLNLNQKFTHFHNLVLGGEFIRTDPNYYLDEWSALNLTPFYSLPNAKGYHVYASAPVADHLVLRLGLYHLHQDPGFSAAGTGLSTTNEANYQAVYTQARIDF